MNKVKYWTLGALLSGMFWVCLLLLIAGCGRNDKETKVTYSKYLICSTEAYVNRCTNLVVDRLLYNYELYSYYCLENYRNCLGRR